MSRFTLVALKSGSLIRHHSILTSVVSVDSLANAQQRDAKIVRSGF